MGAKRKSEDPESILVKTEQKTEQKPTKKRKKKHRRDKEKRKEIENGSPVSSPSSRKSSKSRSKSPGKPTSIRSRISELQKLAQELAAAPESVREYTGENGFHIVHAIAELGRAFADRPPAPPKNVSRPQTLTSRPPLLPPAPPIKDPILETAAFTHHGVIGSLQTIPGKEVSYDRLEVLGDAYLEVIATRLIWDQFKTLNAGRLCQARELLVKNETLAEYSVKYGFDKRARVPSDYASQPKRWLKTKGDIFEAYVAAVILADPVDGFELVEEWLTQLWLPKLKEFQPVEAQLTAKEELSKRVMGKGIKLQYVDERPPTRKGGLQTFFIGVYITGWGWTDQHLGSGTGLNKVIAGNEAAKQALANRPLIDEINAVKKEFDEKTRFEREQASANDP